MGEQEIRDTHVEGENLRQFLKNVLTDLRALEQMLNEGMIESGVRRIGAEQEMFLVDHSLRPAMAALEALRELDDEHFTTELGLFNLEVNLDPQVFGGKCLSNMEKQLDELMGKARVALEHLGLEPVLTGILPTLRKSDLGLDSMTPFPRYKALNREMSRLRGGTYEFHIKGIDELIVKHDSVMLEAANASFQVHFQVGAEEFANLYNIAQVVAAPIMAIATNSPMLFGRRLWRETRIALFQQAVDTRRSGRHLRERSPRVTFGRAWVQRSVLELYREDISRFRVLISDDNEENAFERLSRGEIPSLNSLRLHNGTVYRWNRACYGITDGKPHLRIENRVLPSGPSVIDEIANAALWYGLVSALSDRYEDVSQLMEFEQAKLNFKSAARHGLSSQFIWLDGTEVPAQKLICDKLLPLAEEGLKKRGIDGDDIRRYLNVISKRCSSGQTGSQWMLKSKSKMRRSKASLGERLNALTSAILSRQKEGKPVAEWDLASHEEAGGWKRYFLKVEQYMTTDLFTVREDEPVDLVANLMEWERIRHVPVEDHSHRLVGLISYRMLLRLMARGITGEEGRSVAVSEVMRRKPITVSPETLTLKAIDLMRKQKIGCLPVVKGGRLVGIVTERDFMDVAAGLLEEQLKD